MSGLKDNASKYLSKIAGFVGAIPPIPSGEDKNLLRQLEKMKVGDPNYSDKYVAVVEGKIVDTDRDKIPLAKRVYGKHGYIPMYIGKVIETERTLEYTSPERGSASGFLSSASWFICQIFLIYVR